MCTVKLRCLCKHFRAAVTFLSKHHMYRSFLGASGFFKFLMSNRVFEIYFVMTNADTYHIFIESDQQWL